MHITKFLEKSNKNLMKSPRFLETYSRKFETKFNA